MHGIILKGLKDFTIENYDEDTWNAIRDEADVDRTLYVPVTDYPDEHVVELVQTASELSGVDVPDLMHEFGSFLVPMLVQYYGVHVQKQWDGLELIENVEQYIHMALRKKNTSTFEPPEIRARREGEDRVVVEYGSDRQLCEVAMGIIQGVGEFYEEAYAVSETHCMKEGSDTCEFVIQRQVHTEGAPGSEVRADEIAGDPTDDASERDRHTDEEGDRPRREREVKRT